MAASFFDEKHLMPNEEMVASVLADAYPLLCELLDYIQGEYENTSGGWKYYGKAAGWCYKLSDGKRTVINYVPNEGSFRVRVGIVETEAYMEIEELPDDIKDAISAAIHYAEGRFIDIEVSRSEQLSIVKTLLKIRQSSSHGRRKK